VSTSSPTRSQVQSSRSLIPGESAGTPRRPQVIARAREPRQCKPAKYTKVFWISGALHPECEVNGFPHMSITLPTIPLLSETERLSILNHPDGWRQLIPSIWCRLWDHVHRETRRCISDCSREHLVRIALQMQQIGVLVDHDASSFKVCFLEGHHYNLRDPWARDYDGTILLPRLPSLIDWVAGKYQFEIIEEMSILAGFDAARRKRFWDEARSFEEMLDILTVDSEIADEIRCRLLDAYEDKYVEHLDTAADAIYGDVYRRLEALALAEQAVAHARRLPLQGGCIE
jgi:hypothetical protein